jgi:hypothetical protein
MQQSAATASITVAEQSKWILTLCRGLQWVNVAADSSSLVLESPTPPPRVPAATGMGAAAQLEVPITEHVQAEAFKVLDLPVVRN